MKPNLVFIHGFLGSPIEWLPVINDLDDWNCVPLSFPKLYRYDISSLADSIYEYIRPLGKCHFVGYSMGGRILLDLYEKRPEIFSSLILESTNPGIETDKERQTRLDSDLKWAMLLHENPDRFYIEWYQQPMFGFSKEEGSYRAIIQEKIRDHLSIYPKFMVECSPATNPSRWDLVSQLKIPTLYLAGEKDVKYLNIAERISAQNPKIAVNVIKSVGHNTHFGKPHDYAQLINKFLSSQN